MKSKKLIIIIGESTGFQCFKNIIELKYFKIAMVVSADKNYHNAIKKICKINRIKYLNSYQFKKKKITFSNKNQKLFLISIFSNLILNKSFLKKFGKNCFNLHPGILPYYPGKNCVSGVLYNNEKKAGVSLHYITERVDQGTIIKQKKIKISDNDNLLTLMVKLKKCSVELIDKFIKDLYKNKKINYLENKIYLKKIYPKIIPNNGLINLNTNYSEFRNLFRASYFGPFNNTWGKLNFFYKNKNKNILDVIKIKNISKNILSRKIFVKKISKDKFNLNIQNKVVTVLVK
tara:strand:+ start:2514 stop:3380 length:867 start_codon:yes stop_codon:yes gene_type:complete